VIREIPLDKERITIGRRPQNDIQIENLAVSGEHACIVTILNDSFLEDLGSTNGTLVNGNAVKKHFLQNNDVIELGKYKLKFIQEVGAQPAAAAADFEKTMVLRPSAMKAAAEQAKAMAGQPQAAQAMRAAAVQAAAISHARADLTPTAQWKITGLSSGTSAMRPKIASTGMSLDPLIRAFTYSFGWRTSMRATPPLSSIFFASATLMRLKGSCGVFWRMWPLLPSASLLLLNGAAGIRHHYRSPTGAPQRRSLELDRADASEVLSREVLWSPITKTKG
jgi:hypothetical protein